MNKDERQVAIAWSLAAKDLGLRFESPFVVSDASGSTCSYVGLLHKVGALSGLLILTEHSPTTGCLNEREYAVSVCSSDFYSSYTKEVFLETVLDWGWKGSPEEKPRCFKT
jgi:hypothetical protein